MKHGLTSQFQGHQLIKPLFDIKAILDKKQK
jgi:hypothetical protein